MVSIDRWLLERELGGEAVPEFELVEAHFGLLPDFAENIKYSMRTYNAQCDRCPAGQLQKRLGQGTALHRAVRSHLRVRLAHGQPRPTQFTTPNEETRGVVRLWSPWKNPANGACEPSFAMLTINAGTHPPFMRMHRSDPKRPPEKKDKRMVVVLPEGSTGVAGSADGAFDGVHESAAGAVIHEDGGPDAYKSFRGADGD